MSLHLLKKRIAVLLTICITFGNTLYVLAEVPNSKTQVQNEEVMLENGEAQSGEAETAVEAVTGAAISTELNIAQDEMDEEEITQPEEIVYLESKLLEKDKEYTFSFSPDKSALYYIHSKYQSTITVSEQSDLSVNKVVFDSTGIDNQDMIGRGYYLEVGKTYYISISSSSNQSIKIIRGYKVYFFDYDEYKTFTEAGGTIQAGINTDGYPTLNVEGSVDIDTTKFKQLSYQYDNWYASGYSSYTLYEGDSLEDVVSSYTSSYRIQKGYYELEGLYNDSYNEFNENNSIESNLLILAKYENMVETSERLPYNETIQLNKNEAKIFEFTPVQTGYYYLIVENTSSMEIAVVDSNQNTKDQFSSDYRDGLYLQGYYFEIGETYSIYIKASQINELRISRGNIVYYIDYDMYKEFITDGGTIALNSGNFYLDIRAPKSIDINKYKNANFYAYDEDYYTVNFNNIITNVILEGETIQGSVETYKNWYPIRDFYYELENIYDLQYNILNANETLEENTIFLAKYENKSTQTQMISLGENKTLEKNQWYTFSFQPDESAVYYLNAPENSTISILDQEQSNVYMENNIFYQNKWINGYSMRQGVTYTIYLKASDDYTFTILKSNKLFVIDQEEYTRFTEAGGEVNIVVDESGNTRIEATGADDLDDSNFYSFKKVSNEDGIVWEVKPYISYDVLSPNTIKSSVLDFQSNYKIVNGYYEFTGLYDTSGSEVKSSQKLSDHTIILAKYENNVEQVGTITLSENIDLKEGNTYAFLFTPDKDGIYFIPNEEVSTKVSNPSGNVLYIEDYMYTNETELAGYHLQSQTKYIFYIKCYEDIVYTINRGYKAFYFDYDEYQAFVSQAGKIYIDTTDNISLKAEGENITGDFKHLYKYGNDTNDWNVYPFASDYVLEGDNLNKLTNQFKEWYNIVDGFYELENYYEESGFPLDTSKQVNDHILILGKYLNKAGDAKMIGYQEVKSLKKDTWYHFTFKPNQTAIYYMLMSDSHLRIYDESMEEMDDDDWIYLQDHSYNGYYLKAGVTYTIYLKAYSNQTFQISRAYKVYFFDYDEYDAFTASGGSIKINVNQGYTNMSATAPNTVKDNDFKYLYKYDSDDEEENASYWYASYYTCAYVLDGDSLKTVVTDYQADHIYAHKYKLKNLYQTNKTTTINPNATVTDNLLILAKYEPEYVYVQSIAISGNGSIKVGDTSKLSATIDTKVKYKATNSDIKWSSSNTKVATVDQSGNVKGVGTGKVVIKATAMDGSNVSASYTVAVAESIVFVGAIKITGVNSIYVGNTTHLIATVTGSDGKKPSNSAVTWSSSNSTVASVSSSGLVTGKAKGTVVISVKSNDGAVTATYSITVKNVEATKLKLNYTKITMKKGSKYTWLKTTFTPTNTTDQKLTWSSSNKNIATVNASGTITAKNKGTATITATTVNGVKASVKVTVTTSNIKVSKVTLNLKSKTVTVGATLTLSPTITPINATNSKVTWKSSNTKVAKVSSKGVVTAVGVGKATITCAAKDTSGKKASFTLTVKAPGKTTIKTIASKSSKTATLTWKAISEAQGYEIYAATSKNGTYKKVATVRGADQNNYTVKNLKSKTTYYFIVKAYVSVSKTKIYSSDSGKKAVKIK